MSRETATTLLMQYRLLKTWDEQHNFAQTLLREFPTEAELAKPPEPTGEAEPHPLQQWGGTVGIKAELPSLALEGFPSGRDRNFRLKLNRTAVLMLLSALPHLLDPKLKAYPSGRMVFTSLTPGAEHSTLELRLCEPAKADPETPESSPSAS